MLRSSLLGRTITKRLYSTESLVDDVIHKVDFRVGKIVHIEQHKEASHLFIEQVDLNTESTETMPNPRTIVSGLAPYMSMDSLLNKSVIVVSNLKPSKFRGVLSQGMLLACSENDSVQLLSPPKDSLIGERLQLENIEWKGEPETILKPKQKIFEQIIPFLKTNEEGIATYKGIPFITSKGKVIGTIKNAQIS